MCGRFVRKSTLTEITDEFEIYDVEWVWEPSYNIAPGQNVACVTRNGRNKLVSLRWGLIPPWADNPEIGYRMINARAETLTQKQTFARAFERQRCLVVADGFYEWRKEGEKKTPVYFHMRDARPFGFAGIYELWQPKDGPPVASCTIITTRANQLVAPTHDRMPVIIGRQDRLSWLDPGTDVKQLDRLLRPYDSKDMVGYAVSTRVNSPRFNDPELIKPAT